MEIEPVSNTLLRSAPLHHGFCFSSYVQVPALTSFDNGLGFGSVSKTNPFFPNSCFQSWSFITTIETLTETGTVRETETEDPRKTAASLGSRRKTNLKKGPWQRVPQVTCYLAFT
jgi:carbohydrate-binding DOMON domain-containing protein